MTDERSLFERACRGERGPRVPVWIMRQAGRYLPEYRKLREKVDFLTATKTPSVAAEISLQPMRRFSLDAAIIFSDIMTPLEGMGVPVEFSPGPVIRDPIRSVSGVAALRELDPNEHVPFVLEAIRLVRSDLDPGRAVIGFAGAPFTLFCYLVEGAGSKEFMAARGFMKREPEATGSLLDMLGRSMTLYLIAQARAGADAVMLFDSWSGLLGPSEYRNTVLPVLQAMVTDFKSVLDRPFIYFARGCAPHLDAIAQVGADVVGVDWSVSLNEVVGRCAPGVAVQGNLDPAELFSPRPALAAAIERVLHEGANAAGHVFNLGHGIHQTTDPDQLAFLVDHAHAVSERMKL